MWINIQYNQILWYYKFSTYIPFKIFNLNFFIHISLVQIKIIWNYKNNMAVQKQNCIIKSTLIYSTLPPLPSPFQYSKKKKYSFVVFFCMSVLEYFMWSINLSTGAVRCLWSKLCFYWWLYFSMFHCLFSFLSCVCSILKMHDLN